MSERLPQENENLSNVDLGELARWLDIYNRHFSLGSIAGRHLTKDESEEDGKSQGSDGEQQISFAEIERRTRELLAKSGLSLERIRSGGFVASSDKEGADFPSVLRVNIGNGAKFLSYLGSLTGDKLSEEQRQGLIRVAEDLALQLAEQYDLENGEDDRALELFGNASKIISEYKRLDGEGATGCVDVVSKLKRYLEVSKKGYLREQLLVEKEGLLAEVGGRNFGPSRWHTDSAEEVYWKHWEVAKDAVSALKKNPKASELLGRVVDNLKASIDYAKRDITKKLSDGNKEYFAWWNNEAMNSLGKIREEL